jgi:hypothetical protein
VRGPDYELWYALMADVRKTWPVLTLDVPVERLEHIRQAAEYFHISTAEFCEMAVRERLANEWWQEFSTILNERGPEPCFLCGDLTDFVDVHHEAPFCNSGICNWAIDEDLRMDTVAA